MTATTALWWMSRRYQQFLPSTIRVAFNTLLSVALLQATLGISTILYSVPIPLAATHQAGSLTLLSINIYLYHLLKTLKTLNIFVSFLFFYYLVAFTECQALYNFVPLMVLILLQ